MKKNILMIISMALIVSFLFLVSVQFSTGLNIVTPVNGSNLSASSGLITFVVNYTNGTDLPNDAVNVTIWYNVSGNIWLKLGNYSCEAPVAGAAGRCTGTLNISKNESGANILGLFQTTLNVSLYDNNSVVNWSGSNLSAPSDIANSIFTIDNQGPNVTNFNISNDLLNGLNFSSSIVKLNATINTSWIVDGTYTVTVWANDSLGNWNSSAQRLSFTVDTTAPVIALTRNDASSSKAQLVIDVAVSDTTGTAGSCLADRVDAVRTGSGNSQTFTETGLTCGTGYVYKITCVDYLSFSTQTVATTFTTDTCSSSSGGSSGGSGGGSSTTTQVINAGSTVSVKESQISSSGGYSAKFSQDAKINFDLMPSASNAVQANTLTV